MTQNAYIHIPFCKNKCHYCSFISFVDLGLKDEYLSTLKKQITTEYQGEELNTLYFGGGTPSLLNITDFIEIFNLFKFERNAEITVEVNPDSIYLEYLQELHKLGVNRLSIGAQTFNEEALKLIGRRHNSAQITTAVKCAKDAGFKNISLDLIYGLPNQSENDFLDDLKTVVKLGIQHISLYGLKIDEGCYFHDNPPKNLPDLDLQAEIYLKTVELLKDSGFQHYEISNFAKISFESKHNLNYWENNSYYGFGCAASGYCIDEDRQPTRPLRERAEFQCEGRVPEIRVRGNNIRYSNETDLQKYIQNPLSKISVQSLKQQEILEEAIFLGFRKIAGINIEKINKKFGINFEQKYAKILQKYSDYFVKTPNDYALTLDGILISNEILAEFIQD
jgi:oxygen-independent coproporphyrinogen III oxidase